jgi:hypothetical protein
MDNRHSRTKKTKNLLDGSNRHFRQGSQIKQGQRFRQGFQIKQGQQINKTTVRRQENFDKTIASRKEKQKAPLNEKRSMKKTNVMQICTTDDINFNNIENITINLLNVYFLLEDNLKQINNKTIDFYETENLFMFNVVDLLPQDTFRYCLNAKHGIKTINERQVSQMVDDITSYIETNYAGNLNDAPIWDDTKQSGPMQEEQSGPMQEVRSEEQNLLKTLTKFINIFYTIKPDKIVEVKNYKNLFMFMSMYLVAYGGDGQDFYYQLGSRYVITYLIFCNITGPTLVFMLDVNFKLSEHWDKIVEFMRDALNKVLNISGNVMNDDVFYSFLNGCIEILMSMSKLEYAPSKTSVVQGYRHNKKTSDGVGGGKDNTTHISKNITHHNDISNSNDCCNNEIIKMSGGSCQNITYFNPLLSVKCLYEWSHDFSSGRAQKYVMNDPDFYKNVDGIFLLLALVIKNVCWMILLLL